MTTCGHELVVWNRTRAAAEKPELEGATVAANAEGALTNRHVVGLPCCMTLKCMAYALVFTALLAGCAQGNRASGQYGSTHTHRFSLPPAQAARCFARNAEEHSSALVAEVNARDSGAEVIVRVKNGVTYAIANFRRSNSGASGTITLMVRSSGGNYDLFGALVEGC